MVRIFFAFILLIFPAVARAEWREAVSTNFIVVSEEGEKTVRQRAEDLERFGLIVQAMTGAKRTRVTPRIKVYFVRTINDVAATMAFPSSGVAGYYNATIRGPFAVMPTVELGQSVGTLSTKVIRQHELTHHFMYQYFPAAYPSWYSEGFADYMGAIEISPDNVVKTGLMLENRKIIMRDGNWLPAAKLLTAKSYADVGNNVIALYGQGWLLVHYLNSTPEGKAQLRQYLVAINAGESYEKAAAAFGDLGDLDKRLRAYAGRAVLNGTATSYTGINIGPITVRKLDGAEGAMVRQDLTLSAGLPRARAQAFVDDVRNTAARYPNDPYALRILTEAERLGKNRPQAVAAADRWLAAAPQDPLALMHRAQLTLEQLRDDKSTDTAAWEKAREGILAANKLAPSNPQILKAYYDSFVVQGIAPTIPGENALLAALRLLPQDEELRVQAASDLERQGRIQEAIFVIRPLAYQIRDESEMSAKEKVRRDRLKVKYALAGARADDDDDETPRTMLTRLEKKLAEAKPAN